MKAAFDKVDVTPGRPCHMGGYDRKEMSNGILDPIQINTMVMELDEQSYFIESVLDTIILEKGFCDRIKNRIADKFHIPYENINISCIHTHSAPAYFKLTFEDTKVEPELTKGVEQAMTDSISSALLNLEDCIIKASKLQIDGLYGNRNDKAAYSDKNVYLIDFINKKEELIGCFLNMSAHPTILDGQNYLLSSDLIGWVRLYLEKEKRTTVLVTNGACGDVSTRFYRKGTGVHELKETAKSITEQILEKQKSVLLQLDPLKVSMVSHMAHFDASADAFLKLEYARLAEKVKITEGQELVYSRFLLNRLQKKMEDSPFDMELYSQVYCFGNFFLVALPGDVVSTLGRRIKEAFLDREVILVCYSNTYTNYLVDSDSYGKYFETYNSRLAKNEADLFVDKVIAAMYLLIK